MPQLQSLRRVFVLFALACLCTSGLQGQAAQSLNTLLGPHRAAMDALRALDGMWRGSGWTLLPSGDRAAFTQTIRVGPVGEGALKVIEGRSFSSDGQLSATNFEIVSYNASTSAYSLRLYAQGTVSDVPITPTGSGFTLEYPAADATVRFTISIAKDIWSEVAERSTRTQASVRFLELTLRRVGNTDWPAAGAVPPH